MPLSLGGSHGENFLLVLIRTAENHHANNFSFLTVWFYGIWGKRQREKNKLSEFVVVQDQT